MLSCPKCLDIFRKQERYDKHVAKCPGKVCKNCGKIGHLACGIGISGAELKRQIQERRAKGERIYIVGLF